MYEKKTEDVYKYFIRDNKIFVFSNYSPKLIYYDDSNKLVLDKMEDKTGGITTEETVGSKSGMYSFLLYGKNEHEKAEGAN